MARWTIHDPVAVITTEFVINPSAGGSPQYRKAIRHESTLAPGGAALVFEGQRPLRTGSFTGTILTAAHYTQLRQWFEASTPLTLTDDLGRVFSVVITEFLPDRVYSSTRFYRHSYTCNYLILSGTDL